MSTPQSRLDALTRHRERGDDDRAALDALLDEVSYGTLATVLDGEPWVVPMLCARDGDQVLLHGSTGAGALRHGRAGSPVALSVTAMDALVLAHSTFEHSANYRSAVLRGRLEALAGDDARRALDAISDRLLPGRTREVRAMTSKEIAATTVLALPIEDGSWLYKARTGGPSAAEEEHEAWRGVVPLVSGYGEPVPEADSVERPIPASVTSLTTSTPRSG